MAKTEEKKKETKKAPAKKSTAKKPAAKKTAAKASAAKKAPAKKKPEAAATGKKPAAKKKPTGKTVRITQIGSPIGRDGKQRKILVGLGLNKMHKTRELEDTPAVRGMLKKVSHLVRVDDAA